MSFERLGLKALQILHSGAWILSDLKAILGPPKFPFVLGVRSRLHAHV